ncbi:hypothetical protein [Vannielia sp.]|uniref:hypothetical protein n=1 Tax=Vannielia sp. TaxID=2813045 RepID=UPI0026183E41|nr:hypothetical protein [Vannielia sp.]MDF1873686.1 hypothetical protein [Vannielia sp.]
MISTNLTRSVFGLLVPCICTVFAANAAIARDCLGSPPVEEGALLGFVFQASDACLEQASADGDGEGLAATAVAAGRAGAVLPRAPAPLQQQLIELLLAFMAGGDTAPFEHDAQLADAVSKTLAEDAGQVQALRDYALARRETPADPADVGNMDAYVEARPAVWMAAAEWELYCRDRDCGADISGCDAPLPALKRAAVAAPEELNAALANCPVSPARILRLRGAGIIDASCSSTMQVNAVLANGGWSPRMDCALLLATWPQAAWSDADVAEYIRRLDDPVWRETVGEAQLARNAETLDRYFPGIFAATAQNDKN